MKKRPGPVNDGTFWVRTVAAVAVLSIGLVAVAFQFSANVSSGRHKVAASELDSGEKAATIEVTEGSGWLSTGEELQIAEWYTGSGRGESGYFANFRGSDGGATVDLRLAGLNRPGTFECTVPDRPTPSGAAASVELRVDVDNTYRSGLKPGTCEVTVTQLDGQVMEGRYTATLVNSGDPADDVTITGRFRASRPQAERVSALDASPAASPKVAEL